jgi:hypothetical protein
MPGTELMDQNKATPFDERYRMVASDSADSSLVRRYTTFYFLGHTLVKSVRSGTTESIKSGLTKFGLNLACFSPHCAGRRSDVGGFTV